MVLVFEVYVKWSHADAPKCKHAVLARTVPLVPKAVRNSPVDCTDNECMFTVCDLVITYTIDS